MTKQHFEAFALEICSSAQPVERRAFAARIIIRVAQDLNPRFDADKFLRACGLDELVG